MADIRINSLPSTATSFNTDDYIAIDGASAGTRKMLAATLPLTDVTFGTSGPSAKSSIAARAARQGLVFDGTAGVSANIGTIGSSAVSFGGRCTIPASGTNVLFAISASATTGAQAKSLAIYTFGTSLYVQLNAALGNYLLGEVSGFVTTYAGKVVDILAVRSTSGNIALYVNGVATSPSFTSVGGSAPANWQADIDGPYALLGITSISAWVAGTFYPPVCYNRALSAAEVVSLYEAGVPSGADYNNASNTSLTTGTFTGANVSSASSTGFTYVFNGGGYAVSNYTSFSLSKGQRLRLTGTVTLNGGKTILPQLYIDGTSSVIVPITSAGAFSIDLTCPTTPTGYIAAYANGDANYTISGLTVTRIGLLLAPDAAQAGGGLVWYDTSGNAANITLPASGVSWNVPSSRVLGGNWTTSGNLTVSGGTGTIDATSGTANATLNLVGRSSGTAKTASVLANSSGSLVFGAEGAGSSMTIAANTGNTTIAYNATVGGNLTVTGTASVTGQINGSAGYQFRGASATTYELLRYAGGTNNPGIFVSVNESTKKTTIIASGSVVGGQTLVLGAEGAETLTLGAANATLAGNLTVSGTGTSALTSSSANLVVGSTTATSTNAIGVPQITTESDLYSSICSMAHNNTNGNHGFLMVGKSRGTKASPTILADGDVFGELGFVAYDGAAYRTAGQIRSVIAGTPGATDLPCALDFRVAPDGSSTPATAMRIAPTGNLLIGGVIDGGQKLQVAGVANSSGAGYTNSGFQITNTTASRTVGLFLTNAGVTTIRDVTGAADLFTISLLGAATFGGAVTAGSGSNTVEITPSSVGRVNIKKEAGSDAYIELAGNGNTAGTSSLVIGQSGADLGVIYNRKNAALSFGTNGTERLSISASGAATFTGNIGAGGVNPVVAYSSGGSFYGSGANPQVRLVATSTGGWAFSTYTNVSATGNWSAGLQATGQTYRITNDLDLNGTAALSIAPTTLATTFGGTISTSAPTGGAGAWELGVYTATAPTATGYVTIEIGGTQYKLLAATA